MARLGAAVLAGVLLAGCGPAESPDGGLVDGSPPPPPDVDHEAGEPVVELRDFRFVPAELELDAGTAEIEVANTGRAPHTFTVMDLDIDVTLGSGETATTTITAEPGTYDMICRFHQAQGMVGTLIVP